MTDLNLTISGKHYKVNHASIQVLDALTLNVPYGDRVAILGPSGCGKTTLLRFILGLEKPDQGKVIFGGSPVIRPGLDRGVMFQDARLLPWLTVAGNVAFAQKINDAVTVNNILLEVGLLDFAKLYPSQLSGGMLQRVALARALINRPKLLCLDEPFNAVDKPMRTQLMALIQKLQQEHGFSLLLVTHQMDEATTLCQRIISLGGTPTRIMNEQKL